jgi:D-tyrosyl-tRNA(Tyr) deacylase
VISDGVETGRTGPGLLVFLGIESEDGGEEIPWLVNKILNLRIFPDDNGVMNRSVIEAQGEVLLVSQFTLHASTRKGNRPSYSRSAKGPQAEPLYEKFRSELKKMMQREIPAGVFGADMQVSLINDGPVTIMIDSKNKE